MYVNILKTTLKPFIDDVYPDSHRFMQDNDPKHTSRVAVQFFQENGINWWKTPAESPDCNPIENLWHEMKEFLRREVKPTRNRKNLYTAFFKLIISAFGSAGNNLVPLGVHLDIKLAPKNDSLANVCVIVLGFSSLALLPVRASSTPTKVSF